MSMSPDAAAAAEAAGAAPPAPAPGWIDTGRDRRTARRTAVLRHPALWLLSAVRRKRGITGVQTPVGANEVLERVAALPVSVWTYGFDHGTVRHLGPMAQDFTAAFGLGSSDRRIDMVDANGVALASIQALHRRVVELEAQVARLTSQPQPDQPVAVSQPLEATPPGG